MCPTPTQYKSCRMKLWIFYWKYHPACVFLGYTFIPTDLGRLRSTDSFVEVAYPTFLWDWSRETGRNSDRYQGEIILKCLHETGMNLKPCSCKHFIPRSEFLFPATMFLLFFALSLVDLERFRVFMWKILYRSGARTGLNSFVSVQHPKWVRPVRANFSSWFSELICMGSNLKSCRCDFVPVSCNQPLTSSPTRSIQVLEDVRRLCWCYIETSLSWNHVHLHTDTHVPMHAHTKKDRPVVNLRSVLVHSKRSFFKELF